MITLGKNISDIDVENLKGAELIQIAFGRAGYSTFSTKYTYFNGG